MLARSGVRRRLVRQPDWLRHLRGGPGVQRRAVCVYSAVQRTQLWPGSVWWLVRSMPVQLPVRAKSAMPCVTFPNHLCPLIPATESPNKGLAAAQAVNGSTVIGYSSIFHALGITVGGGGAPWAAVAIMTASGPATASEVRVITDAQKYAACSPLCLRLTVKLTFGTASPTLSSPMAVQCGGLIPRHPQLIRVLGRLRHLWDMQMRLTSR